MIEAELKARVRYPERVRAWLDARAEGEPSTYHDTYYELPNGALTSEGRELRIRTIAADGTQRVLLTYKEPAVDSASGSKPEYETEVADSSVVDTILRGLELVTLVSLEKRCVNYQLDAYGRAVLATLVTVPELDGTFLEVENLVPEEDLEDALADLRALLGELGIDDSDLTTDQYTDAVIWARHR